MRGLFICNTVYQCIVAITIKLTKFKKHKFDIIISDHFNGSLKVKERLSNLNIFDNIYYAETFKYTRSQVIYHDYDKNSTIKPWIDLYSFIKLKYTYKYLFVANLDDFAELVYGVLSYKNPNLRLYVFEDGTSTYTVFGKNIDYIAIRERFFNETCFPKFLSYTSDEKQKELEIKTKRKFMNGNIEGIYVFEPDLICYNTQIELIQIKKIDKNDRKMKNYLKILNYIFVDNNFNDKYEKDNIFLEEPFFCDGKQVNDVGLVEKISKSVGKDNIYVKIHPRNKQNRFKELGYSTNNDTRVPWEVILSNNDFSKKTLITITSSAAIMPRVIFKENIRTILLYKCIDVKVDTVNDNFKIFMDKFCKKYGEDNFFIPNTLQEAIELIKQNKKI